MKTIGIDIRSLQEANRSGVGEFTYELLAALFKIDRENEYFLFSNAKNLENVSIPPINGAKVRHFHSRHPNRLLNLGFKLFNFPRIDKIIKQKPDIFIFPNINFYAMSPGIKKICVAHDLSYELFPKFYSPKSRLWHWLINGRKFYGQSDRIAAVSQNTKKDLVDLYGIEPEKIEAIYPGVGEIYRPGRLDESIRQKYGLPKNFILYLGNIEPRKNLSGLVSAFKKISKDVPHHLVIAGKAGFRANEIVKHLPERAMYINYVDAKDKPDLYRLADLFVFPSFYEGFGFPPLEALACGTPVVASQAGSLSEVLDDAAILVNPHNDAELAQAISRVLNEEGLSKVLLENSTVVLEKYQWQKTAKKLLDIIKDM